MVIKEEQKDGTVKEFASPKEMLSAWAVEEKNRPFWLKVWEDWFYYPISGIWRFHLKMWPREIQWWWQRGSRGYSDCDVWGFSDYLAGVIVGGLRQLKTELHGWPHCEEISTEKEWENIIDKMIRAFELHLREAEWTKLTDAEQKEKQEGMLLFARWFGALWS